VKREYAVAGGAPVRHRERRRSDHLLTVPDLVICWRVGPRGSYRVPAADGLEWSPGGRMVSRKPLADLFSVSLRVGTSRCDVPARVQKSMLAPEPRSAPERGGDAAARHPYLDKQIQGRGPGRMFPLISLSE